MFTYDKRISLETSDLSCQLIDLMGIKIDCAYLTGNYIDEPQIDTVICHFVYPTSDQIHSVDVTEIVLSNQRLKLELENLIEQDYLHYSSPEVQAEIKGDRQYNEWKEEQGE